MNKDINTTTALRNLLKFSLAPRWKKMLGVALLVLAYSLIELGLPKILELYIKAFDGSELTLFGFDMSFLGSDRGRMLTLPLMLVGLAILRWLVAYIKIYHQGKFGQDVLKSIRSQIYNRVQRFPFEYHDKQHSGTLISNLVEDVRYATIFFEQAIFLLMESTIFLVAVFIFISLYSPAAAFASLGLLFLGILGAALILRHAFPILGRTKELFAHMVTQFTENMEGQLVVRAYGRKKQQQAQYRKSVEEMHRSNIQEIRWELFANQLIVWSSQLGIPAIVFAYIYSQKQAGLIVSGGELILLFAAQVLIISKSRQLSRGMEMLVRFSITSRRLHEFFILPPEKCQSHTGETLSSCHSIDFKNVSFAYGQRQAVIKEMSFNFSDGQLLGIAGTTGSGKSTMVQLICGFYTPQKGHVFINDRPQTQYSSQSLRENIAIVFQETFLFAGTIRENIAFGTPKASDYDIEFVTRISQAEGFIKQMPNGLDTIIGERGVSLSGGQRQRISIARALIHQPELLILDSCTSALDTKTEKAILTALSHIKNTMTIVISHRRSALETADKIIVLDDGILVEQGKPSEIAIPGSRYMKIMEATHAG